MVRRRRKTPATVQKDPTEGDASPTSPASSQHKKSREKCRGKVDRTRTPNQITEYFDRKENTPDSSQENRQNSSDSTQNLPTVSEKVGRKVLRDANYPSGSKTRSSKPSNSDQNATVKTETCVSASLSKAVSRLNIKGSKKLAKPQPRLVIVPETVEDTQKTITQFFPVRRSSRKTEKTVLDEKRRDIERAVLAEREDGLKVKNFGAKGRGVIATKLFTKGEFVLEYAGELISMEEAEKREVRYAENESIGCYMYYFKHQNNHYCVDATAESGRLGRLLNHSKKGNLMPKSIEVSGTPRLILLAKRDIVPGCELTYDYGDRSKQSLEYHPWLAR